ncbi:MAG: hypothetical protein LWY06_08945 [Firmicutes bacterium]|nr:hypothetical protein [Bacillota bacterium]
MQIVVKSWTNGKVEVEDNTKAYGIKVSKSDRKFFRTPEDKEEGEEKKRIKLKIVSSLFTMDSILDWQLLLTSLKDNRTTSSERIWCFLNKQCKEQIGNWTSGDQIDESLKHSIIKGFNEIIDKKDFYDSGAFKELEMPEEGKKSLKEGLEKLNKSDLQKFNWLIFESVYPQKIAKNQKIDNNILDIEIRDSFWKKCPEIRNKEIGIWFKENNKLTWKKGKPHEFNLTYDTNKKLYILEDRGTA